MYCIARQCVLPPFSKEQAETVLTEAALQSLTELFEAVPDPRGVHGLRYDLPFLLTCLIAALLCNCDGTEAVLTVKGNQPTLYENLATYFADPLARYRQAETVDRRRGRTEVRSIKVSTEMNAYLAPSWPFVAQVAQLTRTVTKAGQTSTEVVYLITTLTASKASPGHLLDLNQGHWSIENRTHYVRDVTDRAKTAPAYAPATLHKFWPPSAISPLR
jgi:predicted transposase YbfD/YdcC